MVQKYLFLLDSFETVESERDKKDAKHIFLHKQMFQGMCVASDSCTIVVWHVRITRKKPTNILFT